MTPNDALDARKTDAGSWGFLRGVQALKDPEQLVGALNVESSPVIANRVHDPLTFRR